MFIEHQPKWLRASTSPIPDDARNLYLDTVLDESLRIVLQYLWRRPQHHISPILVNTALDVVEHWDVLHYRTSITLGVRTAFNLQMASTR